MRSEFSVQDAKRAGLWGKMSASGKPTPWVLYPDRMLLFRARGFNLRDNFGDVLKGSIEQVPGPIAREYNEVPELPRLIVPFNRTSYSRLRQLIDHLNTF